MDPYASLCSSMRRASNRKPKSCYTSIAEVILLKPGYFLDSALNSLQLLNFEKTLQIPFVTSSDTIFNNVLTK